MAGSNVDPVTCSQISAAHAVVKFLIEHQYPPGGVARVKSCLEALQKGDLALADSLFNALPFGGVGSLPDWIPPVVFSNETPEYNETVFHALLGHWQAVMRLKRW